MLMVAAALLLQCCWYSIRVGAPSPTLGRSPTADVGAHYKGGHPIWAAYRVALNSYRVGAPYKRRHPIRNKWASRNRGGVVVRERGGAGGEEEEGVRGSARRDWKITFLGVPGRSTVVPPKRGVHVYVVEALYPPGLAWRRWRWLVDEGKEKGWD